MPDWKTKQDSLRSFATFAALVLGFIGAVSIYASVISRNPTPAVVSIVFVVIFAGVFFLARRPGVTIAFPDRPSHYLDARSAGARAAVQSCRSCGHLFPALTAICPKCGARRK